MVRLPSPQKVIDTSVDIFKSSPLSIKVLTLIDFLMQVQPYLGLYLTYTATRCGILCLKYNREDSLELKQSVWQQAQLYSSTKVLGLLVSQVILTFLGLTTLFQLR